MSAELPRPLLASPCIGTCRLDAATGWCLGCARDAVELTRWRELDGSAQAAVWADLPRRKARLGLAFRLRPWPPADALRHLVARAAEPGARLAIGPYEALPAAGLVLEEGRLQLWHDDVRLKLRPDPTLRLFELGGLEVLAVHRSRLAAVTRIIRELGPDAASLDPEGRTSPRFDLGLSMDAARIAVRTADPAAVGFWRERCGRAFNGAIPPGDVTTIVDLSIGRFEHRGPPPAESSIVRGLPDAYAACLALSTDRSIA